MTDQQTVSKNQQIKELFKKDFADGEWDESGERSVCKNFTCTCKDECGVNDKNPKFSSWIGDENTRIMIIAEAPSASNDTEGGSCYFSGEF